MSKPELILHIGTLRTGTTAIQRFLHSNKQYFLARGVVFERYRRSETHDYLYKGLIYDALEKLLSINIKNDEHNASSEDFEKATLYFMKCFKYYNASKLIISNEEFFNLNLYAVASRNNYFMTKEEYDLCEAYCMNKIKHTFSDFDIKLICYLRSQDTFLESSFAQRIKADMPNEYSGVDNKGHPYSIPQIDAGSKIEEFNAYCMNMGVSADYYNTLMRWSRIFGSENIIVRPFERGQLHNGVVSDFCFHTLGFDYEEAQKYNNMIINQRLNRDVLEFKLKFKEVFYYYFKSISDSMGKLKENQLYFSPEGRRRYMTYFASGNVAIAKEFLKRSDGTLFFEKLIQDEDTYKGLSLNTVMHISRALINEIYNENIKRVRHSIVKMAKQYDIDCCFESNEQYLNNLMILLDSLLCKDNRILIYGIHGIMAKNTFKMLSFYDEITIYGVVDKSIENDEVEHRNTKYHVYKYEDIEQINPDVIIISEQHTGDHIYSKLTELQLRHAKIYPLYDCSHEIWNSLYV